MISPIRIVTHEEYKAIRARLGFGAVNGNARPKPALVADFVDEKPAQEELVPRTDQEQDHHVRAWWAWKAWRGDDMPVMQYIKAASYLVGISIDDLRGSRSNKAMILKRHAVIRSALYRYPDVSLPKLGKLFHRDHTSILHVQDKNPKIKAMRHRKPRRVLSEAQVLEIRATVPKGGPYGPAAEKYGVTYSSIFYVVNEETWKHLL
jgi:hypothetical protein